MEGYVYIQNLTDLVHDNYSPRRMQEVYGDLEAFYENVFYNIALVAGHLNFSQQYNKFEACIESDLQDIFEACNKDTFSAQLCVEFEELFTRCCKALYSAVDQRLFTDLAKLLNKYYRAGELPSINVKVVYSHSRNELIVRYDIGNASVDNNFGQK